VPSLLPSSRLAPRWSVTGQAVLFAASTAGLPSRRARVLVAPPLFCRGPRSGLTLRRSEATKPVTPVVLPMRLLPWLVNDPSASGLVEAVLRAMMVLLSVFVPPCRYRRRGRW
jgi:hypothetical protein